MGEVTTLCEARSRMVRYAGGDRNATVTLDDVRVQLRTVGEARAPTLKKRTYPDAGFAVPEIGT